MGGISSAATGGARTGLDFGKYEVTRSQDEAVVGATAAKAGGIPQPRLPQTNLTRREIDDFVDAFNAWLSKNAPDKLPKNSGSRGWLRLPTEEEWEFAARGGTAVSAGSFAARTPYSADLTKFEWFAGARSSYGKLKEIGLLEPNPLGIYDLLGNAAEMTNTLYQIDGRTGGYTIRGGSFRTAAEDVRASLRTEQPQYDRDGHPSRDETISFRLVVASQVITDENRSKLAASAQSKPAQRTDGRTESKPASDVPATRTVLETQAPATLEKPSAIELQLRALQEEVVKLKSAKVETDKSKAQAEMQRLAEAEILIAKAEKAKAEAEYAKAELEKAKLAATAPLTERPVARQPNELVSTPRAFSNSSIPGVINDYAPPGMTEEEYRQALTDAGTYHASLTSLPNSRGLCQKVKGALRIRDIVPTVEELPDRPPAYLASTPRVIYYGANTRQKAIELADVLSQATGLRFTTVQGATPPLGASHRFAIHCIAISR